MPELTTPLALVDEGLGNSSYLVRLGGGRALVIDPERDPGRYLAAAEMRGLTIDYTAETHLHADLSLAAGNWPPTALRCSQRRLAGSSSPTGACMTGTRSTWAG